MTQFTSTVVPLAPGLFVTIDGNSKITAGNGDFWSPDPNAFSLPNVSTCPGATPACLSACYVSGLKDQNPDLYEAYAQNERVLHRALMSPGMHAATARELGHWIAGNCRGGFRWHVSGDVMHDRHAMWIRDVCGWSPDVRHWIYTRTFEVAPILASAKNLIVNLSADRDNLTRAESVAGDIWDDGGDVRICYLSQGIAVPELPPGSVIFPDYPNRGRDLDRPTESAWWKGLSAEQRRMVCPADFFGQSSSHRCGPCRKCLE